MDVVQGRVPVSPEVSLAIPCYNEEDCIAKTIPPLIEEFLQRDIDLELVLVDNGSTDRTGEIIDEFIDDGLPVVKIWLETNTGYSRGVIEGLAQCRAPSIGYMHADGQVAPMDVLRTYRLLDGREERVLVKVRRRFRGDSWQRKFISIVYNFLMKGVFGWLGSMDINGCPKMFSRRNFAAMQCRSRDWFLDPEIVLKANKMGLRIVEIDVEGHFRQGGVSHVRVTAIAEFLKNMWIYRMSSYLRKWSESLDEK